jgi:hypothetical protein
VAVSAAPPTVQTTPSRIPSVPDIRATGRPYNETFHARPSLLSVQTSQTPPAADLRGSSGAFTIATGPRARLAIVHLFTHCPRSSTTQLALALALRFTAASTTSQTITLLHRRIHMTPNGLAVSRRRTHACERYDSSSRTAPAPG